MTHLSLFSGGGGADLTALLLGWRTIGYVEYDKRACDILEDRITDGCIPQAPIWQMDIRKWNREIASEYAGRVDVLSAGFPCQPFSTAGKQLGEADERNMWPATRDAIRIVRPRFAFLENVPALISCGYLGVVLGDLAALGYDAQWGVLSASAAGAHHRRDRLWIVGNSTGK